MSGSGGSYFGPSTFSSTTSCETLQFDTQLASPKAQVVSQLSVGDILQVSFAPLNNQQVVVAVWNDSEAGSIVHPQLNQLRSCMLNGEVYEAKVLGVSGGQVRLRVSHV